MHAILLYIVYALLSYLAITVLLFLLAFTWLPSLAFYARCFASYGSLLFSTTCGVLISIIFRLCGYGRSSQWAAGRAFKYAMQLTTGVHFDIVEGEEYLKTRPAVFIANHQTELDVLLLGTIFPPSCGVTAKKSLKWVPFLGWFMALSGTVFIDRSDRQTAMVAFDRAADEMRKLKQSVFIFPEGTRSYSDKPELLPFKKGSFHLAVKAQVPVVPIVSENYSHVLSLKRKIFRSGSIKIRVLPPISTAGLTPSNVDDLTKDTREAMLKTLTQFSEIPSSKAIDGVAKATGTNFGKSNGDGVARKGL